MLNFQHWPFGWIAGIVLLYCARRLYVRSRSHSLARENARRKRLYRDKRREELLNLLRTKYAAYLPERPIAERIYRSTAVELLEGLTRKDFSYRQVVLVFSLRALKIGQALSCTTEEFFDSAMDYAKKLDESDDKNVELLLKGIPISLKDQFNQEGADSSMGLAMRNFRPSLTHGLVAQLLKEQGAIPGFVRSATIQAMMLPDTESETYGTTLNPYDLGRSPGGSTGGEGALIASCGSPIGMGTDIGGSIRIPAHFCGIFGFKPTPGRLTNLGVSAPHRRNAMGETNIRATIGPLARSADDLVLVMRALLQENMWLNDPALARQPWRDECFTNKKRLTIGFYTNDTWFSPAPACIRAVNEAAETLRKLGHRVVPYTPIDIPESIRIYLGIIGADGNKQLLESLEDEAINPLYIPLVLAARMPKFLRPFLAYLMRRIGERRNAQILQWVGEKTVYQYFDLVIDLKIYTSRWLDDLKKNNIDMLLTPVNGLPAYRRGQAGHLFHSCTYTFLFNVLHFPAGVVPVTVVRDDEQYYEDIGQLNRDRTVSLAKDVCCQSAGLPIGVQIAGLPNDDERVLAVMKELEEAIGRNNLPMPNFANDIDIYTD